jgi:hypothetical protein
MPKCLTGDGVPFESLPEQSFDRIDKAGIFQDCRYLALSRSFQMCFGGLLVLKPEALALGAVHEEPYLRTT